MTINNNGNQQTLGLVDSPTVNLDVKATAQYLENETAKPLEHSMPAVRPVAYQPDIQTMTVDYSHPLQQELRGVVANQQGIETPEQFEMRVQHQESEITQGRSIYNTSPKSGGAPNIEDGKRLNASELEKLKLTEKVKNLSARLRTLQFEETQLTSRLSRTREAIRLVKEELED